jgi:hypothetical protein
VTRRGNELFIDSRAVPDLINDATRWGVKVLGLEGFLVGEDATYPALSQGADFSDDRAEVAARKAMALLKGGLGTPTHAGPGVEAAPHSLHKGRVGTALARRRGRPRTRDSDALRSITYGPIGGDAISRSVRTSAPRPQPRSVANWSSADRFR